MIQDVLDKMSGVAESTAAMAGKERWGQTTADSSFIQRGAGEARDSCRRRRRRRRSHRRPARRVLWARLCASVAEMRALQFARRCILLHLSAVKVAHCAQQRHSGGNGRNNSANLSQRRDITTMERASGRQLLGTPF